MSFPEVQRRRLRRHIVAIIPQTVSINVFSVRENSITPSRNTTIVTITDSREVQEFSMTDEPVDTTGDLPYSGGRGVRIFRVIGMLLIIGAGVLILVRFRKRPQRR